MNGMTREEVLKLVAGKLQELGLDKLGTMFALEHSVPRGTHKPASLDLPRKINADTLDGHHATDFALAGHSHAGMLTGKYDAEYKSLCVSME